MDTTKRLVEKDATLKKDDLIVITGGGGFIGGNLALYFRKNGFTNIRAVDKKPLYEWYLTVPGVENKLALDRKDYPGAKKAFQSVLDSPIKGPLVARRQQQARIGLAEILIEAQSPPAALQLSHEVINSSSPEDSRILARGYLLRGKIHEQLGETKEALFDYLHVDLLFSQEKGVHAESLYRLASLWPALQHPERGLDARERLKGLYPDSDWAKK